MHARKRKVLEDRGWATGSAAELLDLAPADALLAELRADLAQEVRRRRAERGLTQARLAAMLVSTQPKVSELEHGVASLEQTVRALALLGAERADLARLILDPPAA